MAIKQWVGLWAPILGVGASLVFGAAPGPAGATPFTQTVPGTSITLPDDYPEAGGVAFVLIGDNGNIYYQFSNPTGAFRGFNNNGQPPSFRGNPFTINDPLTLDCGFSDCATYFGGGIAQVHIRFTALDGDTQPGGFDENDISLILNGFNIGSWSGLTTEATSPNGQRSFGFGTGFGDRTFDTGWFSSTNPALLANILSTGQTTTQVLDDDPNDNFWDFRRGPSLANNDIVTVAPGYTLEKTADQTDFLTVGDVINYDFVVTNIGSVPIRNLIVADDVIGTVTCNKTTILDTNPGGTADFATCEAPYTITQEDVDRGFVTNTAVAEATPDFGVLGSLSDAVTVTGPAETIDFEIVKSSTSTAFGNAGDTVPYSFEVTNNGNTTVRNISVTDPLLPGLVCPVPDIAPGEDFTCSGNYTVLQSGVDDWAANSANTLDNTATATGTTARGTSVSDTDDLSLNGPAIAPGITLEKTAQTSDFDTVGDVLTYQITLRNTGNVSYPIPTVSDPLTGGATCPAGDLAPGATTTCIASYTVDQDDIDDGSVENTASVSVTVAGETATDDDMATVDATRTTGLTIDKRLAASSPTSFDDAGISLSYEFVLTNTGNVTLLNPTVDDDLVGASCAATEIAPGASVTCTAPAYVTTQNDLNAGEVSNTADASATEAGPTPNMVTSPPDTVIVPAVQEPELTLEKTAPVVAAVDFVAGNTVTYSFSVENTGNIDLKFATIGASDLTVTDDKIGTFACGPLPLNRGATLVCTADYTITAADVAAEQVVNTATASAGPVTSAPDNAQIAPTFMPSISLVKSSPSVDVLATTDTLFYEFLVTNTGDTTLTLPDNQVRINDASLSAPANCSAQPANLVPGGSFTCTGTRSGVTQAEIDSGSIDNTATAAFDFTSGTTIEITSNASSASVPVSPAPAFTLSKAGPAEFSTPGETISYTFTVENTGNVTLTSVVVTDPLIPGLSCSLAGIAPGGTQTCTGDYVVTQADVDAEVINNTASATAIPAQGPQQFETASKSTPINPLAATKSATIDKVPGAASYSAVGDQITYALNVTNTGTQTLTNLTVTDVLDPGFTCTIPTLAPGVTSSLCSFTYTVTQDDIDAGSVANTATVDSPEIGPASDGETVSGPARNAAFTFLKSVNRDFTMAGETLTYTFRVENTGNVTLSNVAVTDAFFTPALNCTIGTLAPGAVDTATCTTAYVTTQDDVDNGSVSNTATASAEAPAGVTDPADEMSTAISGGPAEAASIMVEKTFDDGTFSGVGDMEDYAFTVTNTGNVTLTNISLSDPDLSYSCATIPDLAPGASTTLCTGFGALEATKTFDQGDVDAALYTNTVSVTGESSALGTAVSDTNLATVTGPTQSPSISLDKSTSFAGTFDTLGQIISYDYLITNTGNITLTVQPTVDDDRIASVSCDALPPLGLAPVGTLSCVGDYTVTQADLDAGHVTNIASAQVIQPIVSTTPGVPPFVVAQSADDTVTVNANQMPALFIAKRVKPGTPAGYAMPGDAVTFEYIVTNTGNVTTTAPVTVSDDQIAGTLTCGAAGIAPGDSVTCEQDWVADQGDVDAGSVTNTAIASTVFGSAPVDSAPDDVTVNAVQMPALTTTKTPISATPAGFFDVGVVLVYGFEVENTGNVTVEGPITITDNLTAPVCPAGDLAPGATLSCGTASYTITANDLDLGSVTNVAFATGSFDGAPVVSPSDDEIYPVGASPALSVTKTARTTNLPYTAVGDVITYDYVLENSGNTGLNAAITVEDDLIGTIACKPAGPPALTTALTPATNTFTCSATYTITQEDLDREFVTNNATGQTFYPAPGPGATLVVSPQDAATVTSTQDPSLLVSKTVLSPPGVTEVGSVLTYEITALNDGNQTLSGVSLSDPLIPTLSCTLVDAFGGTTPAPMNVILLPDESLVCTGTYTVTQDDIDAQELVNTATGTATDPDGETISGTGTQSQPLAAPVTSMVVTKSISPDPGAGEAFTDPGQELTFVISVENTGNITLLSADVTDDRLVSPSMCTVGPIAPGETDTSCVFTYTVTQADFDEDNGPAGSEFGGFTNTATVVARPNNPDLPTITEDGSVFVRGPPQDPVFSFLKSSSTTSITSVGQVVTYNFTVANTGNVTLTEAPVIVDDKIGSFTCAGIPAGGIAPVDFYVCSADYTVTQADMDAGIVTNIATATSSEVPGSVSDTVSIDVVQSPDIAIIKSATPASGAAAGETVTYTYSVQNTGDVTLSAVSVSDDHTSAAGTVALSVGGEVLATDAAPSGDSSDAGANGTWDTLRPGDIVEFTATYIVTQADIDAEVDLSNTATVSATDPNAATITDTTTITTPIETPAPKLIVLKTVSATSVLSTPPAVGETVIFDISVENSGNQTLDMVQLTDTLERADGTPLSVAAPSFTGGDTGVAGEMVPGEIWTYTVSHALTQDDVDAGGVSNSVVVDARAPDGDPVSDTSDDNTPANGIDDPATLPIAAEPGIEAEKTITSSTVTVGETVSFEIVVRNTGNVTLSTVDIASDTLTRADGTALTLASGPGFVSSDMGSGAGTLVPGEEAAFQATYVLKQADIDAGGIRNSATATGTPPTGGPITDISDDGDDGDGNTESDPTELEIPALPAVSLAKTLAAGAPASFDTVGQLLTYEFTVTNDGNVTLFDPVSVADPLITDAGGAITCAAVPAMGVAPGDSVICTGDYAVTQADIDAGQIDNSATATLGGTTSPPATSTIPANQMPELAFLKEVETIDVADFAVGLEIDYMFTTTNAGNTTITAPVTVSDTLIPASGITCPAFPAAGLAPGDSYQCTGTYTVTATDVDLGSITNVASASDGATTSPTDSATTPEGAVPALTVTKTVAETSFANVGDTLTYGFEVENSGTQAFTRDVIIVDSLIGNVTCFSRTSTDPDFTPGETATCGGTHTVTQADLDAGEVFNEAFAQTTFGATDTVVLSPPDSVTTPAAAAPALSVTKSVATLPVTAAGQVLTYTVLIENVGNQTLSNVSASDPLLPGFSCSSASLAPGASLSCAGDYTVTQADVDAGSLANTATATAVTPGGGGVSDEDTVTVAMPAAAPVVSLTKTASPSPFGPVGSVVTYAFAVENTGNVTLSSLTVTDVLSPGFSCGIASLAPGATDTTCSLNVTVTQAMVDAGGQTNTASVTGEDPSATPVMDTSTITTPGPTRTPALEATKTVAPAAGIVGMVVPFGLDVTNTGNVTLQNVSITDVMQTQGGTPVTLDAPFALIASSDDGGDGLLSPGESWQYAAELTLTTTIVDDGGVTNQVTVDAQDPDGGPVSDISDNGNDTDGNTTDDPTVFDVISAPALDVVKVVETSGAAVGDEVVFLITATNIGNVTLSGLSVDDTFTRSNGAILSANVTPRAVTDPLPAGGTATWELRHVLTQEDVDAGGLRNSATVTGTTPTNDDVSDTSNDGDPTDGNTADDPTELVIAPMPGLEVIKTVASSGSFAGDPVAFIITVRNIGNTSLTGITLTDTLTDLDGNNPRTLSAAFTSSDGSPASPEGSLQPGETATYGVSTTLTQEDVEAGGVQNIATATGLTPDLTTVQDQSDDDGVGDSDPTVASIVPAPTLAVTKTFVSREVLFPTIKRATFEIAVENTGNIVQTGITLTDDLAGILAPDATLLNAAYPPAVTAAGFTSGTVNASYDGAGDISLLSGNPTLAPGETGTVTVTFTYEVAPGTVLSVTNLASALSDQLLTPATGTAPLVADDTDGDGIPDDEEGSGDSDGDGVPDSADYDPSGYFYCEDNGRILSGGQISITNGTVTQTGVGTTGPITILTDGANGSYQFFVTEAGTYTLAVVTYPASGVPSTTRLDQGTLDLVPGAPVAIGAGEVGATGFLSDDSAGANPFFTSFVIEAGDQLFSSNNIPLAQCAAAAPVTASKKADRTSAVAGEVVNYTLSFRNDGSVTYTGAVVRDTLPVGLSYLAGSAVVNGAVQEPSVGAGTLDWGPLDLGPAATVTISYAARVLSTGGLGEKTNLAELLDSGGGRISNVAAATITVEPDAVFQCSDVIGKVFEDRNFDGYQNPPAAGIFDDNVITDGKFGAAAPVESAYEEPGIPGVRLVTPDGHIVATDAFGRYSVPCAALPPDIGANFQLKLDTNSLPTGYRMTTENPRNIRLTQGKVAKMNFGAALGQIARVDIAAAAFSGTQPSAPLARAIDGLLGQIKGQPSVVALTYALGSGEEPANGRKRVQALESYIKDRWRAVGGEYRLIIERSVIRVAE